MIVAKYHDNHPRVAVLTRGGTRTRPDVKKKGKGVEQWMRKAIEPMPLFNL